MEGGSEVGYTPPPVANLASRPLGGPKDQYTAGFGSVKPSPPIFYRWGVRVRIEVVFRINEWWVRKGSYLVWGSGVPYMRLFLDFEVHTLGAHRVEYNGTPIPSQVYQTGRELDAYDMVTDIASFEPIATAMSVGFQGLPSFRTVPTVRRR